MSARKVRLVADLIRGMNSLTALDQLAAIPRAARTPIEKTLKSALANAENNFHVAKEDTFIKTITVDKGPGLKRWRARAFGRAAPIIKHSCTLTVILNEHSTKSKKNVVRQAVSVSEETQDPRVSAPVIGDEPKPVLIQEPFDTQSHRSEPFDSARVGRHEFSQKLNQKTKKKKGFIKGVFQRKAG